jgi:peptide/nickel transport system permease protein
MIDAAALRRTAAAYPTLAVGVVIVSIVLLITLTSPWLAPFPPMSATPDVEAPPPDLTDVPGLLLRAVLGRLDKPVHWFGTDASGLDIFSRVLTAPRTDLVIAISANVISMVSGTLIGLLCGFYRGWLSELVMRISDLLQSFPVLISGMILVTLAGRNMGNIILALGLLYTPIYVRLARVETLSQRSRGYVEASRAIGLREIAIAARHVLPNALAPSLIQASVMVGFGILMTAGLSFVGAGVRPPTPEWGLMIAGGVDDMIQGVWWPSVFPGVAISLTVFGFASLGNGLERVYAR